MPTELKRRDLSGIYIFDTLPGDTRRKPTCVEDCTEGKRREWCITKTQDYLRDVIHKEADTFRELCDYLLAEKCITQEHHDEFTAMMSRQEERSKANWAVHELADQVDFVCQKVVLLADACGVTKHTDDSED